MTMRVRSRRVRIGGGTLLCLLVVGLGSAGAADELSLPTRSKLRVEPPTAPRPIARPPLMPRPMPEPPAPVASPPPEVVARPAPEPDTTTGPHTLRWAFASMLVLAAGVLAYYRVTSGAQALVTPVATLRFAPHWDAGAQRIGSVGPLSSGSGVRLLSGLGIGAATIEEDRPATASTRRLRP